MEEREKRCSECFEYKALRQFRKHNRTSDGYGNKCRSCIKANDPLLYLGDTKRCARCRKYKRFSEYYKSKSSPHGIGVTCKACLSEKHNKYRNRVDRFWKYYHAHYERVGDCLEWTGAKHGDGQPVCQWEGRQTRVRRVVYRLAIGELTEEEFVLVTCKNKLCVRQSHFKKGTREDRDVLAWNAPAYGDKNGARTHPERISWKFQQPEYKLRGEAHPSSRLTDEVVKSIRKVYAAGGISQRKVATLYGISPSHVSQIVTRKNWKHVE